MAQKSDGWQIWLTRAYAVRCTPEQRRDIAIMCDDAQARGETPNSVWHQSAKYFGTKCNCCACTVRA